MLANCLLVPNPNVEFKPRPLYAWHRAPVELAKVYGPFRKADATEKKRGKNFLITIFNENLIDTANHEDD